MKITIFKSDRKGQSRGFYNSLSKGVQNVPRKSNPWFLKDTSRYVLKD